MKEFVIPFFGLKLGKHTYDFEIDRSFFEDFENTLIEDGNIHVELELEKTSNMLILNFLAKGEIFTFCDRCGDPLTLPIEGKERVIVKFGDESFNETEEILVLSFDDHEIDVAYSIYEMLVLTLPARKVHASKKDCNQEVIKQLESLKAKQEEQTDPRWAALKNLNKDS